MRVNKSMNVGRIKASIDFRSKDEPWGRFGGGWNWALGFQLAQRTLIVRLFVFSIKIVVERKNKYEV